MSHRPLRMSRLAWMAVSAILALAPAPAAAQGPAERKVDQPAEPGLLDKEAAPRAASKIEVEPQARDEEIALRLERILKATGWFQDPAVRVEEGVVFVTGRTKREQYRDWAGELAQNTRDVVAVVNQIAVEVPSVWDLRPAVAGLAQLWRDTLYSLPFVAFGLVILLVAYGATGVITRVLRRLLGNRIAVPLLRNVIARGIGTLVFLLGLYIVLKISGLTRLALTVVGGTGLFGLVIGIAFRDITENFLASILLSIQRPFRTKDLVEIEGVLGYVQPGRVSCACGRHGGSADMPPALPANRAPRVSEGPAWI